MSVELNYRDTGGEGTPLFVVHGLMGSADNWRSHVNTWQQQRRVVAVDLRNHGRSPHASGMSYAEMAEDLLAVMDRLHLVSLEIDRKHGRQVDDQIAAVKKRIIGNLKPTEK